MNHIYDAAKEKITIEVRNGTVVSVYASNPEAVKVILIDWDNINESEDEHGVSEVGAEEYETSPLYLMDDETRKLYREFMEDDDA